MKNIKNIIQNSLTTSKLIENLNKFKHEVKHAQNLLNEINNIKQKEIYLMTILYSDDDYKIFTASFIDDHVIDLLDNNYKISQYNPRV